VQWVASAHLIALGVSLPACGWLGRRVGVGRLWLAALAAFTTTSGLCALAGNIEWLIALRVLQGIAAGLLIPAGQTILGQAAGPQRLGRVMASAGVAVTLAPAMGPTVGGFVVDAASWPWLFLINLPIGAIGLALGLRYIPRGQPATAGRLDTTGLVLVTVGVPALVYGLTAWGERATLLAAGALIPTAVGLALLLAFGLHARRRADPILDLRLVASPTYAAACATTAFTGAAIFGAWLLFPLYFQTGRGEDVVDTGLLLIGLSAGTAVVMPWCGRLVDRLGGGVISVCGGLATVATTLPFAALDVDADGLLVQTLLLLRGMAIALAVVPPTAAAYKAVTEQQLPDATTQVNILQRVGGALGGALVAVVLATRLADGADPAFQTAFACLTATSALGLACALWLMRTERSAPKPAPAAAGAVTPSRP